MQPEPLPPVYNEGMQISDIIGVLLNYKWLILLLTLLGLSGAAFKTYTTTPVYRIDSLIQTESHSKSLPGLSEISEMLDTPTTSSTEIELITSRSNLGLAVDELNLTIAAKPQHFPVIGSSIARHHSHEEIAAPWQSPFAAINQWLNNNEYANPKDYAWGGENISVQRFDVENQSHIQNWKIQKGDGKNFTLMDHNENVLIKGQVGETASAQHPEWGNTSIFITELVGRPGTFYRLSKLERMTAISQLKQILTVKEKGKKTGIIELAIKHTDPAYASTVLNLIANNYLRRNVEQKSQEAQQMLGFIEQQLPGIKGRLNTAETALEDHRKANGTVDVTMEAQAIIGSSADMEKQISLLQMERAELNQRFTDKHPTLIALNGKIRALRSRSGALTSKLKKLPKAEWESVKLARDVKVSNELYIMLLNKSQELKIAKAGTVGNVRIIDTAAANPNSINPPKSQILTLGLILGAAAGIALALLLSNLKRGLSDPVEIEKKTGLPVYASILDSRQQRKIKLGRWSNKGNKVEKILARINPKEPSIEAIRSLRTSLQFAQIESRNNIVCISGPAPDVGKSFVSVNLAAVMADAGKKVLIVDADARKGYLHSYFNGNRHPGLTDLVTGKASIREVVHAHEKNLHYVSTGTLPPNPSEILMSRRFRKFLRSASKAYDFVIIDTPPVLAVTDPTIVGKLAGSLFLVLKANTHHEKEIREAIKRFEQAKVGVNGLILNQLPKIKQSSYGSQGQAYYQYAYK